MAALEQEWAVFQAERARLLGTDRGRYVLIQGTKIVGIFDTEDEAMLAGYRGFRRKPFFVGQVTEEEPVLDVASFAFDVDSVDT